MSSLSYAILLFTSLIYLGNSYRFYLIRWDDAYITFRFAQRLANGQGLIWNVGGEPVEGYTSLLQVLLLALGIKVGIPPEFGSVAISVASVLASVAMLVMILRRQFGFVHPAAAVVLGLYLVDETTAINSTSGLETQLFVVLLCAGCFAAWLFTASPGWKVALGMSLIVFISVLARPEGVLYGVALYGALGFYCVHLARSTGGAKSLQHLAVSAGLIVLLGLVYAIWKYGYFGYLLPSPFYVKSNQVSLADAKYVLSFLSHFVLWYAPLVLAFALLASRNRLISLLRDANAQTKLLMILAPPSLALAYYLTVTHEVGGAHRFSYPTYFYLVLAVAVFVSAAVSTAHSTTRYVPLLITASLAYLLIPIVSQASWRISPLPPDGFIQYHFKIARALAETGLGSRGTVMTDAAGVIPYVSGFNQVDRVGLTDNYLSGRRKVTPQERENYLWSRGADVYIGYEPPAEAGAQRPEDDPRMHTPYVTRTLQGRKLLPIEERIYVQDPELLHFRMRELRDNWHWVGEVEWPGFPWLGLKAFLYVRKDSPYAETLRSALRKIVTTEPEGVDLHIVDR